MQYKPSHKSEMLNIIERTAAMTISPPNPCHTPIRNPPTPMASTNATLPPMLKWFACRTCNVALRPSEIEHHFDLAGPHAHEYPAYPMTAATVLVRHLEEVPYTIRDHMRLYYPSPLPSEYDCGAPWNQGSAAAGPSTPRPAPITQWTPLWEALASMTPEERRAMAEREKRQLARMRAGTRAMAGRLGGRGYRCAGGMEVDEA